MIRLGTLFSGIGAIEQALLLLGEEHINVFACDNGEIELKLLPADEQKKYDELRKISQKKITSLDKRLLMELTTKEQDIICHLAAEVANLDNVAEKKSIC